MWRSPFTKPVKCTCAFKKAGSWAAGFHTGEDYVPKDGSGSATLVSPTSGTIARNAYDASFGYFVVIRTSDGKSILMAHLKTKGSLAVGASVKAGTTIGQMGSTGNSSGPHLHIEVQNSSTWAYNKNLLKPSSYIDFGNYSGSTSGMTLETSPSLTIAALTGKKYQNGSTIEKTYRTASDCLSSKSTIGNLEKWESCTCYGKVGNCFIVVYNTSKSGKKVGLVSYAGGVTSPRTTGAVYKNGSTKEPVYATIADAKGKKNSIGYLYAYETCACFGKVDGYYIVAYVVGSTVKVGFAAYAGGVK